jgi:hypothetical protein
MQRDRESSALMLCYFLSPEAASNAGHARSGDARLWCTFALSWF